jgi:hypothetical protein
MKLIYVMLLALCVLSGTVCAAETQPASTEAPGTQFRLTQL